MNFDIARYIEKNLKALRDCFEISATPNISKVSQQKKDNAKKFIAEFFRLLKEKGTSQRLIRLIKNHLACFGPKRLGSNLLINKFNDSSKSFFGMIESQLGETVTPEIEFDASKKEKHDQDLKVNLENIQ